MPDRPSQELEQVQLIHYLRVLKKRRWLILIGTLISILMAGVTSALLPKEYETSLQLRIGQVWGKAVDDTYRVAEIINSEPFLDRVRKDTNVSKSAQDMKRHEDVIASVAESGRQLSGGKYPILLNVKTVGPSPEKVLEIAETVARLAIQDHQLRFAQLQREYTSYERQLTDKIRLVQTGIDELNATLIRQYTSSRVNPEAVILGQADRDKQEANLISLLRELRDVRVNNASKVLTQNTEIVFPPVLPEKPIRPKTRLNLILAGLVGNIVFVIMAFFLEYLERTKEQQHTNIALHRKSGLPTV
jgi:uncharacterized protein involved in exopolysaccharide biosynthesis